MGVASCDPNANGGCAFDKRVTTNEHGSYIVEGLYAGAAGVWVEKIGFRLSDAVKVQWRGRSDRANR